MGSDERAIRELHLTWIDAVNAGDLVRLLTLMADDVVFLNPGQAPFGRDGFPVGFSATHQQFRIRCISEYRQDEWDETDREPRAERKRHADEKPERARVHRVTHIRIGAGVNHFVVIRDTDVSCSKLLTFSTQKMKRNDNTITMSPTKDRYAGTGERPTR